MKIGELLFDLRKDPFRDQGGLLQEATAKLLPVWRSAPDAIASSIRERDIRRANLRRFPYHFCSAALATKSEFSSSAITIDFHLLDPDVDRSMAEYAGCRLEWTF
jgi:hypothetical protein